MKHWGRVRQRGRWRFVILYGTLGFGIPFALLWSAAFAFAVGERFLVVLPFAALSPLGGTIFGLWMWRAAERDYAKALASSSEGTGT